MRIFVSAVEFPSVRIIQTAGGFIDSPLARMSRVIHFSEKIGTVRSYLESIERMYSGNRGNVK